MKTGFELPTTRTIGVSLKRNLQMTTQTKQLSTFNFENQSIRALVINNEPWFVAKDLCDTLGITNPSKAILNLDDDEKMISTDSNLKLGSAGNGAQSLALVSESGMYTLILRCRDAVKKGSVPHRFRKWVTSEVLPQIRKTGSYSKTTVDQRTGLRNAVNMLVSKKGLIYSDAYNLVHQYMNVERIEDIPADKLQSAVEYVHRIVLEGELITEQKKDELFTREFTEHDLQQLVWAWFVLLRGMELCQVLHPALKQIGSHYAAPVHDMAYEYRSTLRHAHNVLTRITEQFKCEQSNNWRVLKYLRAYNLKQQDFS